MKKTAAKKTTTRASAVKRKAATKKTAAKKATAKKTARKTAVKKTARKASAKATAPKGRRIDPVKATEAKVKAVKRVRDAAQKALDVATSKLAKLEMRLAGHKEMRAKLVTIPKILRAA